MSGQTSGDHVIAKNRRARHDYFIEDTIEAGLVLTGSEVKSLRDGKASIGESYAGQDRGELTLFNAHIPEYPAAEPFNHEPRRPRRLLVHRKERDRLLGLIQREGATLVPLQLYFNRRGIAKLALGIAKGKKKLDKRETEKKRDWQREKARLIRDKN
ncbi:MULTISPECIES: SsrA-binding protein SmpB [Nisaea]|jgi:SsrA-binding protein|uniref:SsrA-binding protein SmpB n=1 Tax=Nisaea TaxID=390876 RepID=UPI001868C623|nr:MULTISPECIES: SsrA-binding protein SmpB [Nisaea]MBO6562609.1 SsrA-binding protein SmpB [Nisaea sp.]